MGRCFGMSDQSELEAGRSTQCFAIVSVEPCRELGSLRIIREMPPLSWWQDRESAEDMGNEGDAQCGIGSARATLWSGNQVPPKP